MFTDCDVGIDVVIGRERDRTRECEREGPRWKEEDINKFKDFTF